MYSSPGIVTVPGPLIRGATPYGAAAADDWLAARGYLVRRVGAYGFPNALRMTIGTEEANRGVVAALGEFMKA